LESKHSHQVVDARETTASDIDGVVEAYAWNVSIEFGEPAPCCTPQHVHLKKPITCGDVPLCSKKILFIFGEDVTYSSLICP
tara:strand:- start:1398 stop:1643 length:246 start_codon:yes stop_codon:yes gene_type:complete